MSSRTALQAAAPVMRDLMRPDAPQVGQADEALRRVRAAARTYRIRVLDAPGATLTVTCPEWCEIDHEEETTYGTFLADFAHCGRGEALDLSGVADTDEQVLFCEITQAPFDESKRAPVAKVWPVLGGHGETPDMGPAAVLELAERLRRYADALEAKSEQLSNLRHQAEAERRADHEGRWTR